MTIQAEACNGNLTVSLWKGMIEEQKTEELEVQMKEQTEVLFESCRRLELPKAIWNGGLSYCLLRISEL